MDDFLWISYLLEVSGSKSVCHYARCRTCFAADCFTRSAERLPRAYQSNHEPVATIVYIGPLRHARVFGGYRACTCRERLLAVGRWCSFAYFHSEHEALLQAILPRSTGDLHAENPFVGNARGAEQR